MNRRSLPLTSPNKIKHLGGRGLAAQLRRIPRMPPRLRRRRLVKDRASPGRAAGRVSASLRRLRGHSGEEFRRNSGDTLPNSPAGGPLTTERYWNPTVMIRRDIAAVWTAYSFDTDGKRSHCGYDLFEFVRVDGEWKIANTMWTIEPDACPELERGVSEARKRPR